MGLTGSVITIRPELEEWLDARLRVSAPVDPADYLPLERLSGIARTSMPEGGRLYALVFPRTPHSAFYATYSMPAPTAANPRHREWHQVFLHPVTGAVQGQRLMLDLARPWRGAPINIAQSVHRTLALGVYSEPALAVLAVAFIVSIGTGVLAWWPPRGRRLPAFVAGIGPPGRRALTLHNTLGLWAGVPLTVLAMTGIHLVEPAWIRAVIALFAPVTVAPDVTSTSGQPLSVDDAVARTVAHFPDGRMWMVIHPQNAGDVYRVFRPSPRDRSAILPTRQLWLDQVTGAPVHEFGPDRFTAGDVIEQALYPMHSGELFGLAGRVAVALTGAVPLAVFWTGLYWWRQKTRARTERQE